jgi:hypothetical protein
VLRQVHSLEQGLEAPVVLDPLVVPSRWEQLHEWSGIDSRLG